MAPSVNTPQIQQVSLTLSVERTAVAPATAVSQQRLLRDLQVVRDSVLKENEGPMTLFMDERLSPFHIAITNAFRSRVENLHRALNKVLIDIVDRWHDDGATFATRMPLEQHEEDLLRWMSGPGHRVVRPFHSHFGMWRTDYLLSRGEDGLERTNICEINARIPFNGFWIIGMHENATKQFGAEKLDFHSPNNFDVSREKIFGCFDTNKPLYHVQSKWPGVDSLSLAREYKQRFGKSIAVIEPSQLGVQTDPNSPTGHHLVHLDRDGSLQHIEQLTLELFQEEYAEIDLEVLQEIARCSVNDIRNVFLIHDKRILGIVVDELADLVRRRIITAEESQQLRNGIPNTMLSGSTALKELLRACRMDPELKDKFIAKPVRDASCQGIHLGRNMLPRDWLDLLTVQAERTLLPNQGACVIQEMVDHKWFDIVRHDLEELKVEQFHLIGSCHVINPDFVVFGPWRIGTDVHVGMKRENKGLVMSTVVRPDGLVEVGKDQATLNGPCQVLGM